MITPPDGFVPPDMPKDFGRVRAALDNDEAAPEALLGRIIASRINGERVILPSDHAMPSRLPARLVRGAIAAAIVFAALGSWSLLHHRGSSSANPHALLDELGITAPLAAQSGLKQSAALPRLALDTARIHPVRLEYEQYWKPSAGVVQRILSFVRRLERTGNGGATGWRMITSTDINAQGYRAGSSDTLLVDPIHLAPVAFRRMVTHPDGSWVQYVYEFGAPSPLHVTSHSAPRKNGTQPRDVVDTTVSIPPEDYRKLVGASAGMLEVMGTTFSLGWKGSVGMALPPPIFGPFPMPMEVVGEERAESPAGPVDCWKLQGGQSGDAPGTPRYILTYLLRKRDGVPVHVHAELTIKGATATWDTKLIKEQ